MGTLWQCTGVDGQRVKDGDTFVPGPDYCTVCKCQEGKPKFCRAVLCQPPQECKSFRVGKTCCDFICLDNVLPPRPEGSGPGHGNVSANDFGLRMVASAVTAILSLALLLFLIHRLRQRKLRAAAQQQYYEDHIDSNLESCHNNGCCHNAAYCNGNDHVDLFFDTLSPPYSPWKPPSYYYPHNDAPPPYSEAVASSSSFQPTTDDQLPALGPLMVQLGPPPGESEDSRHSLTIPRANSRRGRAANRGRQGQAICMNSLRAARSNLHSRRRSRSSETEIRNQNSPLRSDEVYEEGTSTDGAISLPCYPGTSQQLNDLNRGTGPVEEDRAQSSMTDSGFCSCKESGEEDTSKCNVCNTRLNSEPETASEASNHMSSSMEQPQTVQLRPKNKARPSAAAEGTSKDNQRRSTIEDFQLRLSLDISDSSTTFSEGPTRSFSSTSEDSTSMDNSELH